MQGNTIIAKPIIDLEKTGEQIKKLRKLNGLSVHDLQNIFGFEYPQAVYAWEQGKNIPTIDNLLILSALFNVSVESIIITRQVEVEVSVNEKLITSNGLKITKCA